MGPITFESNELHHYIAFSSLPLPLHTFWKSNHYHYFGNVIITITHYFCPRYALIDMNKVNLGFKHDITNALTALKHGLLGIWKSDEMLIMTDENERVSVYTSRS